MIDKMIKDIEALQRAAYRTVGDAAGDICDDVLSIIKKHSPIPAREGDSEPTCPWCEAVLPLISAHYSQKGAFCPNCGQIFEAKPVAWASRKVSDE